MSVSDHRTLQTGAYTTARTVGRNSVFDLTAHIERLAETARLMAQDTSGAADQAPAEVSGGQNGAQGSGAYLVCMLQQHMRCAFRAPKLSMLAYTSVCAARAADHLCCFPA